jgi:16S rRNA (guanine527-N7)-methyltransferase
VRGADTETASAYNEYAPDHGIVAECRRLGIAVDSAHVALMAHHLDLVYEANRSMNLTRVPPESAPLIHVADSLTGLAEMMGSHTGPWADIGSGAGFPGIPLAVMSDRHVDLIESVHKKAQVLSAISAELCLDVSVLACRAEEAARTHPGGWAAVSARAVAPLPALVELASPLLAPGGRLVCWKGALKPDEEERGARAAAIVGMEVLSVRRFRLRDGAARTLVAYEKRRRTSVDLPRQLGLAQRSPLA